MRRHQHRPKTSHTCGYSHGVAIHPHTHQVPEAAGGICTIDTCVCGARRYCNTNGRYTELSPWIDGTLGPGGHYRVLAPGERAAARAEGR